MPRIPLHPELKITVKHYIGNPQEVKRGDKAKAYKFSNRRDRKIEIKSEVESEANGSENQGQYGSYFSVFNKQHLRKDVVQERLQAAGSDQMNNRPEQRESITLNARQLKDVHGLRFREDSVP
ncbi:hypothetical protein JOQ06_000921, partial [Pogonophryne albipinna]